jgi:hypothetical protein
MVPAVTAGRAAEALRSARPDQIGAALLVGPEPLKEARQVTRRIVRQHQPLAVAARTLSDTLGEASPSVVESQYSLLLAMETEAEGVDIWTPVAQQIGVPVSVQGSEV